MEVAQWNLLKTDMKVCCIEDAVKVVCNYLQFLWGSGITLAETQIMKPNGSW